MVLRSETSRAEFSRPFTVALLRERTELRHELLANKNECAALALRFGILAVENLSGTILLQRESPGDGVRVRGSLTASVLQNCVVTLEPVQETITEEFTALFVPPDQVPDAEDADEDDLQAGFDTTSEVPEAIVHGEIDLGELLAQHLSLSLNPYPKKEGVSLNDIENKEIIEISGQNSAFAALLPLKK